MIYNDNDNIYIYSLYTDNDIISSIHFISLLPRQLILQLVERANSRVVFWRTTEEWFPASSVPPIYWNMYIYIDK